MYINKALFCDRLENKCLTVYVLNFVQEKCVLSF